MTQQTRSSAISGTAIAVPTWPLDQDFDRVLLIDDCDDYDQEIHTILLERNPRGSEVAQ